MKVLPEVQQALQAGRAVVALESTIITHGECTTARRTCTHAHAGTHMHAHAHTHGMDTRTHAGMPYPQNLQTAREVEAVVRQHGATPATIAVIGGEPCIGGALFIAHGASPWPPLP